MRYDPSAFRAWQEAEDLACEADRKLFAKLCFCGGTEVPTATEVADARALRQRAGGLMKKMLDEMREPTAPRVQQRTHAPETVVSCGCAEWHGDALSARVAPRIAVTDGCPTVAGARLPHPVLVSRAG